jgi:hypothetical protein
MVRRIGAKKERKKKRFNDQKINHFNTKNEEIKKLTIEIDNG